MRKKGNSFFDIPGFVMEVVSASTEKYDRDEKKKSKKNFNLFISQVSKLNLMNYLILNLSRIEKEIAS